MRINAALMPSDEAIDHLTAALRDPSGEQDQVTWLEPAHWTIRLAGFGNIARSDLGHIEALMTDPVARLHPLELWLATVVPLPEPGDSSISIEVHGDTDALAEIAYGIPDWVRPSGFVLDRRKFRARIQLGRVTARTNAPYLEALVARLGGYEGPVWRATSVLLGHDARVGADSEVTYIVEADLPFGGRHASGG